MTVKQKPIPVNQHCSNKAQQAAATPTDSTLISYHLCGLRQSSMLPNTEQNGGYARKCVYKNILI